MAMYFKLKHYKMPVWYGAIEICFLLRLKIKWEKFHRESSKTTSSRGNKKNMLYMEIETNSQIENY